MRFPRPLMATSCLWTVAREPPMAEAAEGMWQPRRLPAISQRLAEAGYAGDPAAVVSIGGCSASFGSLEGLVATLHHCACGTIRVNATGERNLRFQRGQGRAVYPDASDTLRVTYRTMKGCVPDRLLREMGVGDAR